MKRNFTRAGPNQLCVTDITEYPSKEGRVYACVVLDVFARKAVGWATDRRPDTALVNSALNMAARSRDITPRHCHPCGSRGPGWIQPVVATLRDYGGVRFGPPPTARVDGESRCRRRQRGDEMILRPVAKEPAQPTVLDNPRPVAPGDHSLG